MPEQHWEHQEHRS